MIKSQDKMNTHYYYLFKPSQEIINTIISVLLGTDQSGENRPVSMRKMRDTLKVFIFFPVIFQDLLSVQTLKEKLTVTNGNK